MATTGYDLIPLGGGLDRPFRSIEVEHQLHLLGAPQADLADLLRAGFRANVAATLDSGRLMAGGFE